MRLKNIYVTCKESVEGVMAIGGKTNSGNSTYTTVTGWNNFLEVFDTLMKIKYVKEEVETLVNCVPSIYRHQMTFTVSNAEWNKILRAKERLLNSLNSVIKLYESMGLNNTEEIGIDIKLPECNDFSDFKKNIEDLEFILYKCPFFKVQEEEFKFKNLDVGSMWLYFAVGGVAAVAGTTVLLNNIAAFIDKCLIIKSHAITIEQQKMQLESMKMEKEAKENLINGITEIYKSQVDGILNKLEEETKIKFKDGEEKGVAAQAIEKTNNLLDKGMQIYATINSPQEVKALFAPLETKYLSISEEIKLLEKKDK